MSFASFANLKERSSFPCPFLAFHKVGTASSQKWYFNVYALLSIWCLFFRFFQMQGNRSAPLEVFCIFYKGERSSFGFPFPAFHKVGEAPSGKWYFDGLLSSFYPIPHSTLLKNSGHRSASATLDVFCIFFKFGRVLLVSLSISHLSQSGQGIITKVVFWCPSSTFYDTSFPASSKCRKKDQPR